MAGVDCVNLRYLKHSTNNSVVVLFPLLSSLVPRVTFRSWRLLSLRGCELSSTGSTTTERSAPRYMSSSKHCRTSGLISDCLQTHWKLCFFFRAVTDIHRQLVLFFFFNCVKWISHIALIQNLRSLKEKVLSCSVAKDRTAENWGLKCKAGIVLCWEHRELLTPSEQSFVFYLFKVASGPHMS